MKKLRRVPIRQNFVIGKRELRVEERYCSKGWQSLEVLVVLVDQGEFCPFCAQCEVCKLRLGFALVLERELNLL